MVRAEYYLYSILYIVYQTCVLHYEIREKTGLDTRMITSSYRISKDKQYQNHAFIKEPDKEWCGMGLVTRVVVGNPR